MQTLFETFFAEPSAVHYLAVRRGLENDPLWSPTIESLSKLHSLCAQDNHQAALRQLSLMWPDWGLSPRVHFLAAQSAEAVGDREEADLERWCFQACLQGVMATGEGTADSPFQITYVSDVHDIAEALGEVGRRQFLELGAGTSLDCLECSSGNQLWFDASCVVQSTASRLPPWPAKYSPAFRG